MATHYSEKQREQALAQLHISPVDGRVNTTEAARILTWRAKREYNITHLYTGNSVRHHKEKLEPQLAKKADGTVNPRMHTYNVEKVFSLDIAPKKTNKGNKDGGIDKVLTRRVY